MSTVVQLQEWVNLSIESLTSVLQKLFKDFKGVIAEPFLEYLRTIANPSASNPTLGASRIRLGFNPSRLDIDDDSNRATTDFLRTTRALLQRPCMQVIVVASKDPHQPADVVDVMRCIGELVGVECKQRENDREGDSIDFWLRIVDSTKGLLVVNLSRHPEHVDAIARATAAVMRIAVPLKKPEPSESDPEYVMVDAPVGIEVLPRAGAAPMPSLRCVLDRAIRACGIRGRVGDNGDLETARVPHVVLGQTESNGVCVELAPETTESVRAFLRSKDLTVGLLIDVDELSRTPLTGMLMATPPEVEIPKQDVPLERLAFYRAVDGVPVAVDSALLSFRAYMPLLNGADISLIAVRDVSRVVELKRAKKTISAYCIFVHHLENATLLDSFEPHVKTVCTALGRDHVPLKERVPGTTSSVVPVIKHTNGRELHVFVGGADTDEARAWNEPVLAYVRHVISQQLPRTDVNLGGRLAAALTEAIDDTLGTGEKVVFTPDGNFVVQKPAPHVAVAMPPPLAAGETIVDVPWKLLVEQDWTGETSDPAYVLEFAMTGLNDAAAEANLRAQLAWDAGIKLERRGRAACETVSVVARGPSGQRVRAHTELQEHNIGEQGAPLTVKVSATGLVRIQFWPAQISEKRLG